MAPSEKSIIAALKSEVKNTYDDLVTRDLLTVRYVRDKVAEKLGLDEGFLVSAEWKGKSKDLVKKFTTELLDQDDGGEDEQQGDIEVDVKPAKEEKKPVPKSKASTKPKPKAETPVKKGVKRESAATKGRPAKRQKKEETPSDDEDMNDLPSEESEASESEFGDTEESDAPQKKSKIKAKTNVKTPVKRQRKSNAKVNSEDEDDYMQDSDAPKPKKKVVAKSKAEPKAPPVKRLATSKTKIEDSGDESSLSDPPITKDEESDESPEKKPIAAKKHKSKVESDDEEDAKVTKDSESDAAPVSAKKATPKKAGVKKEAPKSAFLKAPASDDEKVDAKDTDTKAEGSDSEMSVLIDEDEEQKPKKKRRSKSDPKPTTSKPTTSKTSKPAKTAAASKDKDLSPDEITIKTLQSQLKKCGITKIWAFELKQYGDDTKARIKHLQKALNDVGMKGRFSEARAREIKEARELQADLEAVKEGEKSWGLEGGRAKRSAAGPKKGRRKMVEESSGEDGDGGGNASDTEKHATRSRSQSEEPAITRKVNARSALAFLGSESDE